MYQGKHSNNAANRSAAPHRKRRLRWRREFVLLCSILVLVIGVIGGSLAYLATSTQDITNTFTPANPGIDIPETFDHEVKQNVKVHNKSDYSVYARATYVAYWVSDAKETKGQILPEPPVLTSEVINTADWKKIGDYWYCNKILAATEQSPVFITEITADTKVDCHLVVDVIAETVQADPQQAILDVWGVDPSNFIEQ